MVHINLSLQENILLFSLLFLYITSMATQIYGMYTCFCKKWYLGLASLVVPGFALVIGGAKLFFRKDLLK